MRERLTLAIAIAGILLAGACVSGLFPVLPVAAASDIPPLLLSTPSLAPSYEIGCDFSNPDPEFWTEIAHVDPTECTYWPDQGQVSCGQNCDYQVITVTSGLSYTMKSCAPDCTCKATCQECCTVDTTGWSASVEKVQGSEVLWAAGWVPEQGGCGSNFPSRVTNPICQQCDSSSFTVPGDGEPVALILKRNKIPGFWYHQPHVGYSLFVLTTTELGLYYPLTYSDTLDVTQVFSAGVHNGIDFSVTEGRPVFSVYGGTVQATGYDATKGYYIEVDHGLLGVDTYESHYYHLSAINVSPGENLPQSCQIGWSGDTGLSTGPHLHLGIKKNGQWVDPAPLLVFYPGACRSYCNGLENPDFLDGMNGWVTHNATWGAGSWPAEGIVNLLAGGYVEQFVQFPAEVTTTVHARVKSYTPTDLALVIDGVIMGWADVVGDGQWHVIAYDVVGSGVPDRMQLKNAPFPGYVIVVDWICTGYTGAGGGAVDPSQYCNLVNHTFSEGGTGWDTGGASFGVGLAMLPYTDTYIAQQTTKPIVQPLVLVVARSMKGSMIDIYLGSHGEGYIIDPSQTWSQFYISPPPHISGTLTVSVVNRGPNMVAIDYVCVRDESIAPPDVEPWADCWDECSVFWELAVSDWFNVGRWVEWLWCEFQCWFKYFLLGIGLIQIAIERLYYDVLNWLLWLYLFFWGWSVYLFGDIDYFFSNLLNLLALLRCWLGGTLLGLLWLLPGIAQLCLDALMLLLYLLEAITGLPFSAFIDLFVSVIEGLSILSTAVSMGAQSIFDGLNSSAIAELGLPDPENQAHPLYPFWIGINLVDETVSGTPYQYAAVLAMGAMSIRLILWAIQMLLDW